MNNIVEVAT